MYGGFAWLTNTLGSSSARQRAVLLAGMAAFFVVSLAVPRAFEQDGVAFGVAYLVLTLVHVAGFLLRGSATFAAMLRIGATNVLAALLILGAGFTHGGWHWPLWIAAVLVQFVPPLVTSTTASFDIDPDHFAERHGLMIIIVLGESLISVALAADALPVGGRLVTGALCGLAALAGMWWCYFTGEDEAAAKRFAAAPPQRRGRLALVGYDLPHVVMMAGIVAVAAGARESLPDLAAATSTPAAALIAGGVAVYLLALAAFRALLGYGPAGPRTVVAVVLIALVPVGTGLSAGAELFATAVVLAALLVAERRGPARRRLGIGQDVKA